MSKRFRDREIWQKPWYRKLSPKDRGAWDYLADWCDNVGVWVPDFEAAEFYINGKPDWESLPNKCNGNIIVLDSGKWWLVDFCKFQYGELQESNRAHASYLRLLRQHGLYDLYLDTLDEENKGHIRPLQGAKEQEQYMDKDKDKDNIKRGAFLKPSVAEVAEYCRERNNHIDPAAFIDHYEANGWLVGKTPMKDWRAAVRTWERTGYSKPKPEVVSNRPDAWTEDKMRRHSEEMATPRTPEEVAEVERLLTANSETPAGRMIAAILKSGP